MTPADGDPHAPALPPRNLLAEETSPYLLQHKDNPVHWRAWGAAALAEAKTREVPILLSVGYAACHWCHVMAHESFDDAETAQLMNARFVNVKVDREERPDIDAIYQQALAMLGGRGGWPLTMFLTPDGDPFWGGTYFPKAARYGQPAFKDVLRGIADTYRDAPEKIRNNVSALADGFRKQAAPRAGAEIDPDTARGCAEKLLELVDWEHGGIGGAPKFPQPTLLTQLWAAADGGADPRCREAALLSLTRMAQGGIYDHLGGGFARYSTDRQWLVPHFEKMLYDNALLLPLLALAHNATGDALFRRRAEETAHWLLSDMQTADGGFASARDADSDGREGAYYVWTEAEIDRLLRPDDAALFKAVYDVRPEGNWEGETILNRLRSSERALSDDEAQRLERARDVLLAARETRPAPLKDDKILADWNGMAICGLIEAGERLERPDWIAAAERAFQFVAGRMVDRSKGEDRLHHSWRLGAARHDGVLDDYVQMALAGLALHQASGESAPLRKAEGWAEAIHAHFHDARPAAEGGGGYFFTADDADGLAVRTKNAADAATPAGGGQVVQLFAKLHQTTGVAHWAARADAVVRRFSGELARNFVPYSSLIDGAVLRAEGLHILIVGGPHDADARALRRAAARAPVAHRTIQRLAPDARLPDGHPAAAKAERAAGGAVAYICRGPVCQTPITDAAALSEALDPR
ncbi:MAG: thioredoxin domain-containing protein [Marivibrio sp.]|uniref:thioredoxin domain-containing protein n=1 Tax=Marivibrio sp. TaxID=2039719 RepID=UPI0032EBC897